MAEELTETETIALREAGKRSVGKIRTEAQNIIGDSNRSPEDARFLGTLTHILDFFDGKSQEPLEDYKAVQIMEAMKEKWLTEDRAAGIEPQEQLQQRETELKGFKLLINERLQKYYDQWRSSLS